MESVPAALSFGWVRRHGPVNALTVTYMAIISAILAASVISDVASMVSSALAAQPGRVAASIFSSRSPYTMLSAGAAFGLGAHIAACIWRGGGRSRAAPQWTWNAFWCAGMVHLGVECIVHYGGLLSLMAVWSMPMSSILLRTNPNVVLAAMALWTAVTVFIFAHHAAGWRVIPRLSTGDGGEGFDFGRDPMVFLWSIPIFAVIFVSTAMAAGYGHLRHHEASKKAAGVAEFVKAAVAALLERRVVDMPELAEATGFAAMAGTGAGLHDGGGVAAEDERQLIRRMERFSRLLDQWMVFVPDTARDAAAAARGLVDDALGELDSDEDDDVKLREDGERHPDEEHRVKSLAPLHPDLGGTAFRPPRTCTVLRVQLFGLPVRDERFAKAMVEKFVGAVVPHVQGGHGVIEQLSPELVVASFNANRKTARHATLAVTAGLKVMTDLSGAGEPGWVEVAGNRTRLRYAIVIDSGDALAGRCGAQDICAEAIFGPPVETTERLAQLAAWLDVAVLVTSRTTEMMPRGKSQSHLWLPVDSFVPMDAPARDPQASVAGASCASHDTRGSGALTLFSVIGFAIAGSRDAQHAEQADQYAAGFEALCDGRLGEARPLLAAASCHGADTPHNASALASPLPVEAAAPHRVHARRLLRECDRRIAALGIDPRAAPETLTGERFERHERQWSGTDGDQVGGVCIIGGEAAVVQPNTADPTKVIEGLKEERVVEVTGGLFGDIFLEKSSDDDQPPAAETNAIAQEAAAAKLEGEVPSRFFIDQTQWTRGKDPIGSGAFASVFLGVDELGNLGALKVFQHNKRDFDTESLEEEVRTLHGMRHDNVVGFVSCGIVGDQFVIVMEHVGGGSLYSLLQQFGRLPLPTVRRYMHMMLSGLRFLHANHIAHCDVKPHNALLGSDGTCKLTDFGSVVRAGAVGAATGEDAKPGATQPLVRGTSLYMAPEAARSEECDKSDIWSFGVTAIELLTGEIPWPASVRKMRETDLIRDIGREASMVPELNADFMPPGSEIRAVVEACFQRDHTQRPTAEELLQFDFFREDW